MKETKKKEIVKDVEVTPRQTRGASGGSYTSVQCPLADAFLWTCNRKDNLEKDFSLIYPEFRPNPADWLEMNGDDLSQLHGESPAFVVENRCLNAVRTGKRNSKNVITKKANGNTSGADHLGKNIKENYKYEKLKLFSSTDSTNSHSSTFFVGGPVWAAAWCPYSSSTGPEDQYLATCSHSGEHSLEPQSLCREMELLQLWNCGNLPARPDKHFSLVR